MNEFLFYTAEGVTLAPNTEIEVENCQILGVSVGENKHEALSRLLAEYEWIQEAGYDPAQIIAIKIIRDNSSQHH